eukprot:COSAG06_NODE_4350_length_4342_cov_1.776337_2_plen_167_part_00
MPHTQTLIYLLFKDIFDVNEEDDSEVLSFIPLLLSILCHRLPYGRIDLGKARLSSLLLFLSSAAIAIEQSFSKCYCYRTCVRWLVISPRKSVPCSQKPEQPFVCLAFELTGIEVYWPLNAIIHTFQNAENDCHEAVTICLRTSSGLWPQPSSQPCSVITPTGPPQS